jgi:phosphate transport system protein
VERHFEQELATLREQLLAMGGRAETSMKKAIRALERRDRALAAEIIRDDRLIDRLEIEVEERCVMLLALQQPLARDLRFITAALKISNDLERVGDHAVNIAGAADRLADLPLLKPLVDIPAWKSWRPACCATRSTRSCGAMPRPHARCAAVTIRSTSSTSRSIAS